MSALHVKEAPGGTVIVVGIPSQETALQICEHFLTWGVKAKIGTDAGVSAYHVSVHRLGVDQVKDLLGHLGIEAD
jgi:hypothetical protein